jgi:hypothetical protein
MFPEWGDVLDWLYDLWAELEEYPGGSAPETGDLTAPDIADIPAADGKTPETGRSV